MRYLYEESDTLNSPLECFVFDTQKEHFPIKPHWHYFVEMIYLLEGRAEMYADGRKIRMEEGCMILFHPESVHSIYAADESPLRYAVLKFDINRLNLTPNYAPKLRSILRLAQKKGMNLFFDAQTSRSLHAAETFSTCVEEMKNRQYGFDLAVQAELYQLLLGMIRIWKREGFSVDSEAFAEDNRNDIYNITEYIDAHINSGIKVSDIAAQCGMSYSYFAKMFLSVYGKTCKEYIETMRIFKVEEFLIFTDFDLSYISQETGFSDCSHMIKCFKRFQGTTPKQFRMQHRLNAAQEP